MVRSLLGIFAAMGSLISLLTTTVTAAEVLVVPLLPMAVAVSECVPALRLALTVKGLFLESPILLAPSKNWTSPMSAPAGTATSIVTLPGLGNTVPSAGLVMVKSFEEFVAAV